MPDLAEGLPELMDPCPYHAGPEGLAGRAALMHEEHERNGEDQPPDAHAQKREPYGLGCILETESRGFQCHPNVEGEEEPATEIAEGKTQAGDEVHPALRRHTREKGVVEYIASRKPDDGEGVDAYREHPCPLGDEDHGGCHDDAQEGEE